MQLLYLHQYFCFPSTMGGTRSYDLATSFVKKGYTVSIVTTNVSIKELQNQSKRWGILEKDGLTIYALKCGYSNKMGFYRRIMSFLQFMFFSTIKVLQLKCDVVLATSTPLTIAVPALVKKFFAKTPFIFEVRDVWPEVPIKMGFIKNKLMIKYLYHFEKKVYKRASYVVPLSVGMKENILSRIKVNLDKLVVIPNIAEVNRFGNIHSSFQFPFDINGKQILIYCGALGNVNGLSYLVDLASRTKNITNDIVYCMFGGGKELDKVLAYAKEKQVLDENLFYCGSVSKNELPYLYQVASVGSSFVINNPVLWDNSANKFFDTLAAKRPIVINHGGWQADVIKKYDCGYVLPPLMDDLNVNEFVEFMTNNEKLYHRGENAYHVAIDNYSKEIAVNKYMNLFHSIEGN